LATTSNFDSLSFIIFETPTDKTKGTRPYQKFPMKKGTQKPERCLETFTVHDSRSGLVVFLLGDPHLLEGGQGGQNGATDPH